MQTIKVCANCNNSCIAGDKYCRYCGAPMGEPKIIPANFEMVYGPPPVNRTHTCSECGYSWETRKMIDEEKYCPECGGSAPVVNEDMGW